MNYSNVANGDWMNLGSGENGGPSRDGTRPASSSWGLFAGKPVWRI